MKTKLTLTIISILVTALTICIIGWNVSTTQTPAPDPELLEQPKAQGPLVEIPLPDQLPLPSSLPPPSQLTPSTNLSLAEKYELELRAAEETAEEWWEKRAIQEQQLQWHIDRRNRGEVETEVPDEELDALMMNMGLTELHGDGWGGLSMYPRSDEVLDQAKALDANAQLEFAQEIELLEKMAGLRNALEQERAALNESGGTESKDASRRFYQMQAHEIKILMHSPEMNKLREYIVAMSQQSGENPRRA